MNVRISNMPHFSEKSSPLPSFSHFCYYSRNVFYWVGGYSPPTPLGRTTGPAPIAKNLIFCSRFLFRHLSTRGSTKGFPPGPPHPILAIQRCMAKKEQGVQRANHGFALCPAGAGKRVSQNLKFRRRVQGPGGACRGVLGARSHQLSRKQKVELFFSTFMLYFHKTEKRRIA